MAFMFLGQQQQTHFTVLFQYSPRLHPDSLPFISPLLIHSMFPVEKQTSEVYHLPSYMFSLPYRYEWIGLNIWRIKNSLLSFSLPLFLNVPSFFLLPLPCQNYSLPHHVFPLLFSSPLSSVWLLDIV